jgi:hypothetical protein
VEILICSYSKMQSYASDLAEVSWSMIIWDEGHNLKTSTTKTYKAAFRSSPSLPCHPFTCPLLLRLSVSLSKAQSRIILTGTPIQNKLEELWCLLNIVTYGRFNVSLPPTPPSPSPQPPLAMTSHRTKLLSRLTSSRQSKELSSGQRRLTSKGWA